MVILKTIVGNLSANVNEITFTDAIINSNSIIEVYYNSNDIYTVETWQRENTIGIVTSDHDFPVSVKVLINNVVAFEPYDDTSLVNRIDGLEDRMGDAEDAISGLATRVGSTEDDIDALETSMSGKQDVLIAGDGITIVNNVISSSSLNYFPNDDTPVKVGKYGTRDIYRKRVYFSSIVTGSNSLTGKLPLYDILIDWHGYCKTNEANPRFMAINSDINTANWWCGVQCYGNIDAGNLWIGSQFNGGSAELWIDYVPPVE